MINARFRKFLPILTIVALVISLMTPSVALADDSLPADIPTEHTTVSEVPSEAEASTEVTSESTEETVATEAPTDEVVVTEAAVVEEVAAEATEVVDEAPAEGEPAATEQAVTAEVVTAVVAADTEVATTEEPVVEEIIEPPAAEVVDESVESLTEVVEALADAEAVLTDADGNVIPLASEAAAEALTAPDPVGCPPGTLPTFLGGSGIGCTTTYTSIQAAINDVAVVDGWTVYVEAGTFTEQVTITKSITLQGSGAGVTTIQAPISLTPDANGQRSIVTVTGSGIVAEISGFTVTGPGPTGCGSLHYGIFVNGGATADIHDNEVTDIGDNTPSGCQNGVAIRVGSATLGSGTATIENNTVTDYQKGGIVVSGDGSYADVLDNIVTGDGPTGVIAQNGIQVSYGATANVTGNTVTGNQYTGSGWASSGILIYDSGATVNVTDNVVDNNDFGVAVIASSSSNVTAVISGNTISNSGYGIEIGDYTTPGGSASAVVSHNNIVDNVYGLYTDNPDMIIVDNLFDGNTGLGLYYDDYYETGLTLNAEDNCWGDPSGPTHADNPTGTGDEIYGDVDFTPWGMVCNQPPQPPADEPSGTSEPASGSTASPLPDTVIPVTGDEFVSLDCNLASLFTLQLENKDKALFTCNVGGKAGLVGELEDLLPDVVPDGSAFVGGMTTSVLNGDVPVATLPSGASITVEFLVPTSLAGEDLAILYWDESANENLGGWVELEDPILQDGYLLKTVTFTGTFVMVTK